LARSGSCQRGERQTGVDQNAWTWLKRSVCTARAGGVEQSRRKSVSNVLVTASLPVSILPARGCTR
jgi:hypothetical protein